LVGWLHPSDRLFWKQGGGINLCNSDNHANEVIEMSKNGITKEVAQALAKKGSTLHGIKIINDKKK
jgi:hypothetical protein